MVFAKIPSVSFFLDPEAVAGGIDTCPAAPNSPTWVLFFGFRAKIGIVYILGALG